MRRASETSRINTISSAISKLYSPLDGETLPQLLIVPGGSLLLSGFVFTYVFRYIVPNDDADREALPHTSQLLLSPESAVGYERVLSFQRN